MIDGRFIQVSTPVSTDPRVGLWTYYPGVTAMVRACGQDYYRQLVAIRRAVRRG